MSKWYIIRNPRSSSGKGASLWPEVESALKQANIEFESKETDQGGHAIDLAGAAIAEGYRKIIAFGGDGTVNEVINGIMKQEIVKPEEILFAQIPTGTGNDWGKTIGVPPDPNRAVELLTKGKEILQDVGVVEWTLGEALEKRYFVNIAGMGYDAFVGKAANEKKAQGKGGLMGYLSALVGCLIKYQSQRIRLRLDGHDHGGKSVFSMVVGICRYNGGGMMQCPRAVYDDGLLDITLINDLPKWKVIRNVPRLFKGTFIHEKAVELYTAKEVLVETTKQNLLEVDGEVIGAGTAKFTIIQKGLRVLGGLG